MSMILSNVNQVTSSTITLSNNVQSGVPERFDLAFVSIKAHELLIKFLQIIRIIFMERVIIAFFSLWHQTMCSQFMFIFFIYIAIGNMKKMKINH